MAKKNKSKKSKKVKEIVQQEEMEAEEEEQMMPETDVGNSLTLDEIDAISDDDGDEVAEWNAEAQALRQAIADGAFDKLKTLTPFQDEGEHEHQQDDEDDEDEAGDGEGDGDAEEDEEQADGDSSSDEEDDQDEKKKIDPTQPHMKALKSVASELVYDKAVLPWQEKMDHTPPTPLPFGQMTEDGIVIDVHDDLKREVAFYNLALESVYEMRSKCETNDVPFSRPVDFFAEMVKTDDHMAMVKDRLIFENKKMEAFEQRKSNREQKLRAKEKHAHRLAEKARQKKQHLDDVQDWAKSAAYNRVGGGRVRDDDDDYLNRMGGGPNKKRQAADRRFGHGGKRGRFKQNDRKSLNDMSQYNPKGGNFVGGQKAGPSKRKGKRARDAAKARR